MADTFLTVLQQAAVILIFVLTGFFCGKKKILTDASVEGLNQLVVLFVIACTCFCGFLVERTPERVRQLLTGFGLAIALHILNYVLARLLFRRDKARSWMFVSTCLLTNCGFMGFPMLTAALGEAGVFLGLPFLAVMTTVAWTGGVVIVSGDRRRMSLKKALTTPAILGILAGLAVFLLALRPPVLIADTARMFSALNTPLPMIVVGYYLSQADLRPLLRDGSIWLASAARLILLPVVGTVLLFLCGVRGELLVAMAICNATPPAAVIGIQASMFGRNAAQASSLVTLETLCAILTMPPIVTLAAFLASR